MGTGRWVRWLGQSMNCIWSREVLCEADWESKGVVPYPGGALQHTAAYSGWASIRSSHTQCTCKLPEWLRMVCVDIRPIWRTGLSATVLVDGLHWSHKCLRRICQSFDGVVPGCSPLRGWFQVVPILWRRCLNHRIVVCGTFKHLTTSAVLKLVCSIPMVLSLSTMMGPLQVTLCLNEAFLQGPCRSLFVGIKCLCNVKLTSDYRRSDVWFNRNPQVKMSHSESISKRLRDPWLAVQIWSRA